MTLQKTQEKPLLVLVNERSLLRVWMDRVLGKHFRVCVFSTTEDAIAFVRTVQTLGALVTDLDLGLSASGGCNIAREVQQLFPQCPIFIFDNGANDDHRMIILKGMRRVKVLTKPFGSLFIASHLKTAFAVQKQKQERQKG